MSQLSVQIMPQRCSHWLGNVSCLSESVEEAKPSKAATSAASDMDSDFGLPDEVAVVAGFAAATEPSAKATFDAPVAPPESLERLVLLSHAPGGK